MAELSSLNDVFRFLQLRASDPSEVEGPAIDDTTGLAEALAGVDDASHRRRIAREALGGGTPRAEDSPLGRRLLPLVRRLTGGGTVEPDDFVAAGPLAASREGAAAVRSMSDAILAGLYSGLEAAQQRGFRELVAVYKLAVAMRRERGHVLTVDQAREVLSRPLAFPDSLGRSAQPREEPPAARERVDDTGTDRGAVRRRDLRNVAPPMRRVSGLAVAIDELVRIDRHDNVVQPADGVRHPFVLTPEARARLTPRTREVLEKEGIDLGTTPIHRATEALSLATETALATEAPLLRSTSFVSHNPAQSQSHFIGPRYRPAGVADLLVVKQQIKRYEAAEIAHVENALAGERRARSHRKLERSEELFRREVERTTEEEHELHSADRFELNRETSRTLRNDQQVGFRLSLSGKYGPAVEFENELAVQNQSTSETAARSASRYAREIVDRTVERVAETVSETRSRKLVREAEETNLHELDNESNQHRRGIYQFLEKVYEAQVFNYGVRQMFEFMVPEPASYLWHLEGNPETGLQLPQPPIDLRSVLPGPLAQLDALYLLLGPLYGATELDPPPPPFRMVSASVQHGEEDGSEADQPRSVQKLELSIPDGYEPWRGSLNLSLLSDNTSDLVVLVTIGHRTIRWQPGPGDAVDIHKVDFATDQISFDLSDDTHELTSESKLPATAVVYESDSYAVSITVVCKRSSEALQAWRLATYEKLQAAYSDRLREYEQQVEALKAAASQQEELLPYGAPPPQNLETIAGELRKHCLTILTGQRFEDFGSVSEPPDGPPQFDFLRAAGEGSIVRFFEQAFEWHQLQYVFYPYFWSRRETWADRFLRQDADPQFREFLRAGAARVVVPVRPGFEPAVAHFLQTGQLWHGDGAPPAIGDDTYLPILEEIRQRRGAPEGEIPVGEPWEVRLPTALVAVRTTDDLPAWERVEGQSWSWRPVAPPPTDVSAGDGTGDAGDGSGDDTD